MKAAIITGPERLEIIDMEIPKISEDEVLVKVKLCGICASEFQIWKKGTEIGRLLGHEFTGTVCAVGERVTRFHAGDRVTGKAYHAFAEYLKERECNLVPIPDGVLDIESMGEPLSCLISGAFRTDVHPGDKVAIVGTGFMGLGFLQLMRLKGATKIIAVDVRKEGLEHALKFGADEVYYPQNVPDRYRVGIYEPRLFERGVDVSVESSGTQAGLTLASDLVRAHGILSIVGYHQSGSITVDMKLWNWKAISVVNAHERRDWRHVEYMALALRLIEAGQFNVRSMVTHAYPFCDINEAFHALETKPAGYIKGYVFMEKEPEPPATLRL